MRGASCSQDASCSFGSGAGSGQGEPVTRDQLGTVQLLAELGDERPRVSTGLEPGGDRPQRVARTGDVQVAPVDLHGRSRHRQRGAVQAGERSGAEPDARQDCEGGSAGEEAPQPSRPGGDLPGSRGSRTVQRPDRRRCRLGGMGASSPRGQLVAHACGVAAGQMGRRQAFRNSAFRNSARSSGKLGPARLTLSRTARGRLVCRREGDELLRKHVPARPAPLGRSYPARRCAPGPARPGLAEPSRSSPVAVCQCSHCASSSLSGNRPDPAGPVTSGGSRRRTYVRHSHQTTNACSLSSPEANACFTNGCLHSFPMRLSLVPRETRTAV